MSALPPEVLAKIEARSGRWSDKAERFRQALELTWADVIAVAGSAVTWKRERDEEDTAIDGWKDAITGRDTHGRALYAAGKTVYYEGEPCWLVITIHEDRKQKEQKPKRRR